MMKYLTLPNQRAARCLAVAFFAGLAALSAGHAAAQPGALPAAGSADKIMPKTYNCPEHNVALPLVYIETADNAYVVIMAEGKQIAMARQAMPAALPAAGGVKAAAAAGQKKYYYVSLDEQNGYRWYPEGDKGRLTFLVADDSAKEVPVYTNCRVAEE